MDATIGNYVDVETDFCEYMHVPSPGPINDPFACPSSPTRTPTRSLDSAPVRQPCFSGHNYVEIENVGKIMK
jgi:hypothetical protein